MIAYSVVNSSLNEVFLYIIMNEIMQLLKTSFQDLFKQYWVNVTAAAQIVYLSKLPNKIDKVQDHSQLD